MASSRDGRMSTNRSRPLVLNTDRTSSDRDQKTSLAFRPRVFLAACMIIRRPALLM